MKTTDIWNFVKEYKIALAILVFGVLFLLASFVRNEGLFQGDVTDPLSGLTMGVEEPAPQPKIGVGTGAAALSEDEIPVGASSF